LYLQKLRLFSRDVRLFLIATAVVGFTWDGMRGVLFNLYLLRLGYGPEFVGTITAVGAMTFALSCPPAGALGARWGSRRMIIAGLGLMAAGFVLIPLVEFLPATWHTPWLLGMTLLTYPGLGLYFVNSLPFMMGATGLEERNYVFSAYTALAPLAAFAGSLLAGVLPGVLALWLGVSPQDPAAFRYLLLLMALLSVPGMLAMLAARGEGIPPERQEAPAEGARARDGRAPIALIAVIGLVAALRFGGRGAVMAFFNVYMDDGLGAPTALIGVLAASAQLLSVPSALSAPLLAARWGNARTIAIGTLGMALGALPLALLPYWGAAGLGYMSVTAFFMLTGGPIRVFSQELVTERWRASMSVAFMMGAGLGFSALSFGGGRMITIWGYNSFFALAAVLIAVAAGIFWTYFRVPRGEMAHQSASEFRG
jgi:MFS family permease